METSGYWVQTSPVQTLVAGQSLADKVFFFHSAKSCCRKAAKAGTAFPRLIWLCKTEPMKPSFALDFRDGAIALLHRTSRGWQLVGSSPVDAADLGEALSYMRSTALGLSPKGLATKLVIPDEQVLYTQVHAPGPDAAKRKRQVKAALEGLTPYKVEDLVYDWWGSGPEIHVAVVARETLAEAEAFAAEHRFNPVSFVAAPASGGFRGEPFFGASALSASLLAEGEKVERDQDPIAVTPRDYPQPVTLPPTAAADVPAAAEDLPAPAPATLALPADPVIAAPAPASVPEVIKAEPTATVAVEPEPDLLPDFRAAREPAAGAGRFDPKAMAIELVDEAPMAIDVPDDTKEPDEPEAPRGTIPSSATTAPDDSPEARLDAELARLGNPPSGNVEPPLVAAFASRRPAAQDPGLSTPEPPVTAGVEPDPAPTAPAPAPAPADFTLAAAAAKARKAPQVGPATGSRPSVPRPALAKPAAAVPTARETLPFPTKGAASKFAPGKTSKVGMTAPGIAGPRRERNVVQMPNAAPATAADALPKKPAAKGATGLDGRPVPVRGKPRFLGLILTAILLVALALVAAWSSFYLSANEPDPNALPPANDVASVIPDVADPALAGDLPSVEDESLADGQDPGLTAPDAGEAAAEPDGTTAVATAAEPPPSEVADAAAAQAAATPLPEPAPQTNVALEAAVAGTPVNDPQDEIFLAAADTPPQTSDPLILPQVFANSDPPPLAAPPPPPFGTVYTFDADGRIQPTPEGILTPEGVLLVAGPPPVVPPARPAGLVTAPSAAEPEAAAVAPLVIEADPALAGKKPRARPEGLVEDAATAERQGEVLAPDPNSRFASLRPQQRPAALTQVASLDSAEPEVANEASAASLAAGGIQGSTSPLAVTVSKKPAARPSGMDQAVDAAVAAAIEAPSPEETFVVVAPEADAEPEVEAAAPALPSNASVSRQATVKDALNLSRVALLGIFGTSSGRYAMIRQPGGGVKKVVVGDTIDGGRIAAITATAVEYQKGGRMVTLSLPTG
jgi:hypothetical protein